MNKTLFFWRQRPEMSLAPAAIAQELETGNEVGLLIDLPVREIIERLREAFPEAVERTGELVWIQGEETFAATWTWQHVQANCRDLSDATCSRLLAVLDEFDCPAFDAELGIRPAR